jgi:hypothetical protein
MAMPTDHPYLGFLVVCLGLGEGRDQPVSPRRSPKWNWDKLVQTAANEEILSTMHDALGRLKLIQEVPADVGNLFSTIKELNYERNELILSDLKSICRLLNSVGIEPVVLKGAAYLLTGVYPDPATRYLADLDLLLPASDFSVAIKLLKSQGYCCQSAHPVETIIGNAYPPLFRPHSVEIDLHRGLCLGVGGAVLPSSEVLSSSVLEELDGVRVRIPSPEHLVVHHIVHSQLHDFYRDRIRPSLRNMYDMVLLQDRFGDEIDWLSIEKRFRRKRQYAALGLYLRHVESTMAVASPIPIRMTGLMQLRWWHRAALRRAPGLRWFDPLYLFMAGVKPRTPLREVLSAPGGWKYLLAKPFTKNLYARRLAGVR